MRPFAADRVVIETFVGRRGEMEQLVANAKSGRSTSVSGGRRTGKTMLLRAASIELQRDGMLATYVDAQALTGNAVELVGQLAEATNSLREVPLVDPTLEQVAMDVLEHGRRWCILLDEVEVLTRLRDGAVLLDNLRYVVSNSPAAGDVSVVIAGGLDLGVNLRSVGSPLMNVCHAVDLEALVEEDIRALVELGVPPDASDPVFEYVWENAGGHPYIAQALLDALQEPVPSDIADALVQPRARLVARISDQLRGIDPLLLQAARNVASAAHSPHDDRELILSGLAHRRRGQLEPNGLVIEEAVASVPLFVLGTTARTDPAWVQALIDQGETPTVEFKESIKWDSRRQAENEALKYEIVDTIAGFANADGGSLLLGIAGDRTIVGLSADMALVRRNPTIDGLMLLLSNLLRDALGGAQARNVAFRSAGTAAEPILILSVDPAPGPVFATVRGSVHFYCRVGTSTLDFDPRETVAYVLGHWRGIERL